MDTNVTEMGENLKSLEDYLNHFTSIGFKLVKDEQTDISRILSLRSYSMDEFSEVIIQQRDTNLSVVQTVNGKQIGSIQKTVSVS